MPAWINIRAGVYIAVATRFPDKYDVIIHCVSHVGLFIEAPDWLRFRGEALWLDVDQLRLSRYVVHISGLMII